MHSTVVIVAIAETAAINPLRDAPCSQKHGAGACNQIYARFAEGSPQGHHIALTKHFYRRGIPAGYVTGFLVCLCAYRVFNVSSVRLYPRPIPCNSLVSPLKIGRAS